jgi:predicted alpha/beta hydrolase family esterase
MKTVIVIHGMPTKEEFEQDPEQTKLHWIPWLKHELEAKHIATTTPEMPVPYAPVYEQWKDSFERLVRTEETVLVGHSAGGGFLVRWISEQNEKVGKVILVAPWIDPDHIDREHTTNFFDFTIDPHLVAKTDGVTVFISEDDDIPMLRTVEELEKQVPGISIIRKKNAGHFTSGDGFAEFPELLSEILK